MTARTQEAQYEDCLRVADEAGIARLGVMSNQVWHEDPKRLAFVMARYKFVAKMLSGMDRVLEVGCADAFATRIVQQEVGRVTAIDLDPVFIADARERRHPDWPLELAVHDMLSGPHGGGFDAAYSLDVLEHIPAEAEDRFLANLVASLHADGVAIIGMPSLASQVHASPQSIAGHVNCKDGPALKTVLARHFRQVFVFSMNDEVVHTGYWPMAHYYLGLCCGPRPA